MKNYYYLKKHLLLSALLSAFSFLISFGQIKDQGTPIDIKIVYGEEFAYTKSTLWNKNLPFTLTVTKAKDNKELEKFLTETTVLRQSPGDTKFGKEISLLALMEEIIPKELKEIQKQKELNAFDLRKELKLDGYIKVKFNFKVMKDKPAIPVEITVVDQTNKQKSNVDSPKANKIFIPSVTIEATWLQKPVLSDPPILNDHTRWQLDYDIHRQDPIAIWKRTNTKKNSSDDKNKKSDAVNGAGLSKKDNNLDLAANYKVQSSKAFRPAANRRVLLSVKNVHPYRDSIAVVIDYLDRNAEHADILTSAFLSSTQLTTQTGATTTDTSVKAKDSDAKAKDSETDSVKKNPYPELFKTLRDELKEYYTSKYSDQFADVNVISNGIIYIKKNMTEKLGITDFSESGIIKLAEANSKGIESPETYFSIVREAVKYYKLITGVRVFINKSFLVQNRDAVQITMNRYVNNQLQNSPQEAVNTYNISGGLKVDFSLGLYGSLLKDKTYTTVPQIVHDTTFFTFPNGKVNRDSITAIAHNTRAKIIRDNKGNFSIGPAVYSHLYWKTGREVNAALTIGISVDQQALPRFLLGGSLLLGLEKRWVLSYGAAFGPIKELASGLEEGQVVNLTNYPNSTLPTKDVWSYKGFVAVSFNFSGFNLSGSSSAKK